MDTKIIQRVTGADWYGTSAAGLVNAMGIGKIAEKCIFGPTYGHMPNANEWFMVGDQAVFLANRFPNDGTVQYPTINDFINQVYQALNSQGV